MATSNVAIAVANPKARFPMAAVGLPGDDSG